MKNPFLNSNELVNKNIQQANEFGTTVVKTIMQNANEQMQNTIETNKKVAELFTSQIQQATKANLALWNEMSQVFNKQVESASENIQNIQNEVVKATKK